MTQGATPGSESRLGTARYDHAEILKNAANRMIYLKQNAAFRWAKENQYREVFWGFVSSPVALLKVLFYDALLKVTVGHEKKQYWYAKTPYLPEAVQLAKQFWSHSEPTRLNTANR